MSVYKKLIEARQQFHALRLEKTGLNKFAGYKYFELADFLIPALRVTADAGLCAVVSFDKDIARMALYETEGDGVITIQSPMGSAALKGCHEVQNIGAVETYQRRYLWVAALEIVEHDALDATTGRPGDKDEVKTPPAPKSAIPASFKSSPTMGAMDAVDDERRTYLEMLASVLTHKVKTGEVNDAYLKLEKEHFDDTEKTAIWSLLDSKTRSAIKAAKPKKETA